MISELDDHEDLLLFILRELMTQRRPWKEQMEWSWMVEEFVSTIPSPKEHTHRHQASTWADQLSKNLFPFNLLFREDLRGLNETVSLKPTRNVHKIFIRGIGEFIQISLIFSTA